LEEEQPVGRHHIKIKGIKSCDFPLIANPS
jgi:hypothetical protein